MREEIGPKCPGKPFEPARYCQQLFELGVV